MSCWDTRRWEAGRFAADRWRHRGRNPRYNRVGNGGRWGLDRAVPQRPDSAPARCSDTPSVAKPGFHPYRPLRSPGAPALSGFGDLDSPGALSASLASGASVGPEVVLAPSTVVATAGVAETARLASGYSDVEPLGRS